MADLRCLEWIFSSPTHVVCLCCNTQPMTAYNAIKHLNGAKHMKKLKARVQLNGFDGIFRCNEHSLTSIQCTICNKGPMRGFDTIFNHFISTGHQAKVKKVSQQEVLGRIFVVRHLKLAIEKFSMNIWNNEMKALCFDYMDRKNDVSFVDLKKKVCHWNFKEKISLLELAIWKVAILKFSNTAFDHMEDLYAYVVLDDEFDPECFKQESRIRCGVNVIIPNVLLFLDQEAADEPLKRAISEVELFSTISEYIYW